jgi:hypothetical protein
MKEQNWKQEKVNQTLHLLPDCAVQGGVFADQIAAKNKREIREEELRVIHVIENTLDSILNVLEAFRIGRSSLPTDF